MRTLGLCLALFGALFLFGCGDTADEGSGDGGSADAGSGDAGEGAGIALQGEGWDGGDGIDPTKKSDKVRAVAFFKPT